MRKFLFVILSLVFFATGWAQSESKPRAKTKKTKSAAKVKKSKTALVIVEGAMVYSTASFDSAVISYLPANKKIEVSNKTYGPFYKVKIKKGSYGFVSDVDLQIVAESGAKSESKVDRTEKKPKERDDVERFETNKKAIDEIKAIGLNISSLGFSENINGQQPLSNVIAFGMKYSGANIILPTYMDFNLVMSLAPPAYYKTFSSNGQDPSGYLINMDALLQFPFLTTQDTMVYLGLGPCFTYLSAKVSANNAVQNTTASRFGAEAMIGAAFRFGKTILKLEGKYFYDTTPFMGGTIGIQFAR